MIGVHTITPTFLTDCFVCFQSHAIQKQTLVNSVNNSKVYEELKDETKYLKEQMVDLNNSTACTTTIDENEDLDTRMRNIKVLAQRLKYFSDQTQF